MNYECYYCSKPFALYDDLQNHYRLGHPNAPARSNIGQRPLVAEPVGGDGADAAGRVGIDARRVNRDVALELCAHHLSLAVSYFEAAPEGGREELERVLREGSPPTFEPPEVVGALAFWDALTNYYRRLKREQDSAGS